MTGLRWTDEQHAVWKQREAARSAAQRNANADGGGCVVVSGKGKGSLPAAAAPRPLEREVMDAVDSVLLYSQAVAWHARMNVGAVDIAGDRRHGRIYPR